MKQIKYIVLTVFLIFGMQQTFGQLYKFKTTGFTVSEKNSKNGWGKWSSLEKAEIVITLDTKKNRIIIYSQEIQLYSIINYIPKEETEDDLTYSFIARDDDGVPFTISIITRKKQGNRKQLYINQKSVIVAYNIVNFKEEVKKK